MVQAFHSEAFDRVIDVWIYSEFLCERSICPPSLSKQVDLSVSFLCSHAFPPALFFETRFHVVQVGLSLAMCPRMTLNHWSSCPTCWKITGVHPHTRFTQCWRLSHIGLARLSTHWAPSSPGPHSVSLVWFLCLSSMLAPQAALLACPFSFSTLCWQWQFTFPYKF